MSSKDSLPPILPIPSKNVKYITNKRFGRWLVIGFVGVTKKNSAQWICLCDCGNYGVVTTGHISSGHSKSCGCLSRTHGMRHTAEYKAWVSMMSRCKDKKSPRYFDWGGRGISVCARWEKFENFFSDMGVKPSKNHSLDRIDNEKNYSPENCRWATPKEQSNNRRDNVSVTWQGETHTVAEWARLLKVEYVTLQKRLSGGWTVEKAFTTPARKYVKK